MNAALQRDIETALGAEVEASRPCSGGDINTAQLMRLHDGRDVFVKTNDCAAELPGLFAAEASGLKALRQAADSLRVPKVLAVGEGYLVLEAIETGGKPADFEEKLGRGLAELHRASRQPGPCGFECDTYLGRLLQDNTWHEDESAFWRERRLRPLLDRLTQYPEVVTRGRILVERLDEILTRSDEPPVLIHGDLWSGNAAADRDGNTWVFDPACCFASREVEFGMTRLFGFGTRFEAAYQEVWPMPDGWERRVEVYRLHHLLSHLWHFGGSYAGQCETLLRRLV